MKTSQIKVSIAQNVTPDFYNAAVEDIKNILSSKSFDYVEAKVENIYEKKITVVIRYTYLMNVPGLPQRCTPAPDLATLIQKMASIEFFPAFVQVESVDRKLNPELLTGEILTFTFFKEVPANELTK